MITSLIMIVIDIIQVLMISFFLSMTLLGHCYGLVRQAPRVKMLDGEWLCLVVEVS